MEIKETREDNKENAGYVQQETNNLNDRKPVEADRAFFEEVDRMFKEMRLEEGE